MISIAFSLFLPLLLAGGDVASEKKLQYAEFVLLSRRPDRSFVERFRGDHTESRDQGRIWTFKTIQNLKDEEREDRLALIPMRSEYINDRAIHACYRVDGDLVIVEYWAGNPLLADRVKSYCPSEAD